MAKFHKDYWVTTRVEADKIYYRALYGSDLAEDKICGFCWRHHCVLSTNVLKNKECLAKGCRYLAKNEDNEFWKIREAKKASKKAKKELMKMKVDAAMHVI